MRKQTRCIHDLWHPNCLESFYSNRASDNILEFLEFTPCHRTVTVIFVSCDHFSTVTIIFGQLRSYLVDSYDHVADDWFVSYDHITQVSQAHISKTNAQTNKAWHAKPRPMTPLQYCVQIREHTVAYKRHNRVGQSREIYSNSVPLSPPHWPYPKRIRPPSWPRVAVASSIQNTKLFTWRTWPGAGAVPKCDWAARSQCGFKQRRADHTKYIWYVATHGQSVITTELMIAWIW